MGNMNNIDKRLLDKKWRISHLYTIRDKDSNKVQFLPNAAQQDFEKNRHGRNILLKSRQLGFTTYEAIDSLDDALFTPNYNALIINYEQKEAIRIFDEKINFVWENLPEEIRGLYNIDTQRSNQFTFDFGDKSYSTVAVSQSGRSGTYNRVHITELAKLVKKYPLKAHEIISGTIPSVPLNGRVDIESTAEGSEGLFYDMFWAAWNRQREPLKTEFKAHFYNWRWDKAEISKIKVVIPFDEMDQGALFKEYQEKHDLSDIEITYYYIKWLGMNKDWQKMRQEMPTTPEEAFIGSGHKMFDQDILEQSKNLLRNGIAYQDWVFYEDYIDDHNYCIGADVCEGVGQDASTIVILDVTTEKARVVAEYCSNKIEADLFAYEIAQGAHRYGNPIVGVERNNAGHTTLTILKGIYDHLYTVVQEDKVGDVITEKLGWHTNGSTKPKMMFHLSDTIRDGNLIINSKNIYEELRTYDKEDIRKTKFDSNQSRHWDRVMALAIALQMQPFAYQEDDIEFYKT